MAIRCCTWLLLHPSLDHYINAVYFFTAALHTYIHTCTYPLCILIHGICSLHLTHPPQEQWTATVQLPGTISKPWSVLGQGHWIDLTQGYIFLIVEETRAPGRHPHRHGENMQSPQTRAIKAELRWHFFPDML